MKKIILAFAVIALLSSCKFLPSAREIDEKAQEAMAKTAETAVPIPVVSYFQEKRTIAKWAQRWDKPSVATYVYLVSFGKVLGYYVADGKPASTQSYMMPEQVRAPWGADVAVDAPDIDGTYGANNAGIRFFTAEGTAVEWAGSGASYLYSDTPINFGYFVPKLNGVKASP